MNVLYMGKDKQGKSPGDRRRFLAYASLVPHFKIYFEEDPRVKFDLIYCTQGADLTKALRLGQSIPKLVFDYSNHYLLEKSVVKNLFRNPSSSILLGMEWNIQTYRSLTLRVMHRADLIICSSTDQKRYLETIGFRSEKLTDFFQSEVLRIRSDYKGDGSLFWEGQSAGLIHLKSITPIAPRFPNLQIRVVTDEYFGRFGGRILKQNSSDYCRSIFPKVYFRKWTIENLNEGAFESSLGIIPLCLEDPLISAKPENKLIFMWLFGLYTLCSPTTAYKELSDQTGIDFICSNKIEWHDKIENMKADSKTRIEFAKFLNDFARENYSDHRLQENWTDAFERSAIL